ncbi:MAG TPA: M14 family metallopeptidase [Burkholderiaceae bacterium]|nr:M14 family metallopeptidase [Burkholderiaceae bacterium]
MTWVTPGYADACFAPSYASARGKFLLAADRAGARVDVLVNTEARSPNGGTLTTDVAVLGPSEAEGALLVVSGTHGPEGFVGSAAQIALLDSLVHGAEALAVRVVLVHAINPWGFAHVSRTTENNVDLNRNFIDWDAPLPANPAYGKLHPLLCPAEWTPQVLEAAEAGRQAWIALHGQETYVDVTSRGQYSHADGLNYGGAGREWSNLALETIVSRHLAGTKRIALIDWHTALGERGKPFFLCFNEPGGAGWQRACDWWGRENVESQGGFEGSGRPQYTGLLFHGVQKFAAPAEVTGAVVEFGTRSMDEMRKTLQIDRFLKFGAGLPPEQRAAMREEVLDSFSPFSLDWKRSTLGHAMVIQRQALQGVGGWR